MPNEPAEQKPKFVRTPIIPLSKEECFQQALAMKNEFNSLKPGFIKASDDKIKEIIDKKYANYVECYKFVKEDKQKGELFEEIHSEQKWPKGELRGAGNFVIDLDKSKEENTKALEQFFSNDKLVTGEKNMKFATKLANEANLMELSEASRSVKTSIDYVKSHPAIGYCAYTLPGIINNSFTLSSQTMANSEVILESSKKIPETVERAGRCSEIVQLSSHPISFLFEEDIPKVDNDEVGELIGLRSIDQKQKNITDIDEVGSYLMKLGGTFTNAAHANFDKTYKEIHDKNIVHMTDFTRNEKKEIVERSAEDKERARNVTSFRELGPEKAGEYQQKYYLEEDKKNFGPVKNKKITSSDLSNISSRLMKLSQIHQTRKKPRFWHFWFNMKDAKAYNKEQKIIDGYKKLLSDSGMSKATLNSLTKKNPELPKNYLSELKNINDKTEKRIKEEAKKKEKQAKKENKTKTKPETKEVEKTNANTEQKTIATENKPIQKTQLILGDVKDKTQTEFAREQGLQGLNKGLVHNGMQNEQSMGNNN